jgi:hypothetical protein
MEVPPHLGSVSCFVFQRMHFKHFAARKVFEKSQKLFKPVYVEKAIQTKKTMTFFRSFFVVFWGVCLHGGP